VLRAGDDEAMRAAAWQMTAIGAALLAFVLATGRAEAQEPGATQVDARFRPFLGCWVPTEASNTASVTEPPLTCVIPDGRSAVRVVSLVNGTVQNSDRVVAGGAREPVRDDECSGWETGTWSEDGRRLYLSGELSCDGATRRASGVLSMVGDGEWLDVRAVRAGTGGGLRVLRSRPFGRDVTLPDGQVVPAAAGRAVSDARLAAGGTIGTREVIEASRALDASVLEAWLLERREAVPLDRARLRALADANVADRTIDLLVALDNPTRFTVSTAAPGRADVASVVPARNPNGMNRMPGSLFPGWGVWDPLAWNSGFGWGGGWGWGGWNAVSPWAAPWYGFNSFYGAPWGGWAGPLGPIVVVPAPPGTGGIPGQPGNGSQGERPRMVNGVGATRPGSNAPRPTMSPGGARGSGGGSAGSTGGGGGRTARPRP
jgi:hypothetical protein